MTPVVADADTLFGATTRGLLIHLDDEGLIRLHWSPLILDELSRAVVDTGHKPDAAAARHHEQLMRTALPQAEVPTQRVQAQFAAVAAAMRSSKDTRVATCAHAILADAYYPDAHVVSLVTMNTRDFGVRSPAVHAALGAGPGAAAGASGRRRPGADGGSNALRLAATRRAPVKRRRRNGRPGRQRSPNSANERTSSPATTR